MGGTKGCEAVSSAAGISLCGDPFVVWLGVRLPYGSTFITHSPILRMSTFTDPYFPISLYVCLRATSTSRREGGAFGGRGRPRAQGPRLPGRKARDYYRAQGPQA